jgi:hypothetical protein
VVDIQRPQADYVPAGRATGGLAEAGEHCGQLVRDGFGVRVGVVDLQVRQGEEFCGLRFVDFVGKLRGITLEYLDIPGETFRAMGP